MTATVNLKDIGLEKSQGGFRMAEVPLGQGMPDLKAMVAVVRKAKPAVRFQLEMITRDPLDIPCLSEKYWSTLGTVSGRDLARTLRTVKTNAGKKPLPRVGQLTLEE